MKRTKRKLTEKQKRTVKLALAWGLSAVLFLAAIIFAVCVKMTLDNSPYIYNITTKGTLEIQLRSNSPVYDYGKIDIPKKISIFKVSALRDYAFWDANSTKDIKIPQGIERIGSSAFGKCSSLTKVTIPDSVYYIGGHAFSGCSELTEINIPDGVKAVEKGTFKQCIALKSISIPGSVTKIGDEAFAESGLTSIIIPKKVTEIGKNAFSNCSELREIKISGGATIESCAFLKCASLESLTISAGTSIKEKAFYDCKNLVRINFIGTTEQWKNHTSKGYMWDEYTGDYTVYCTDGTVSKSGIVTLN